MKRELNKKIISICEEADSASAAQMCGKFMDEVDREYDSRVSEGMTELEAYRAVLGRVEEIEKLVEEMKKAEEEKAKEETPEEQADRESGKKNLKRILSKTSTVMWLSTVVVYMLSSAVTGKWGMTWLLFLFASIGQIILDMTEKLNNKKHDRKKVIRKGFSGIMWLVATILYFVLSFVTGKWAITWVVFLVAALVEVIFR